MRSNILACFVLAILIEAIAWQSDVQSAEPDPSYFHEGELAGSLKSDKPLPIFDPDPQHLWNRLFSAFYIRTSHLSSQPGGKPVVRFEGGDTIDFFGWGRTTYWSSPGVSKRLLPILDEFLDHEAVQLIGDSLKRAIMLRDLWAVYDFLSRQNTRRFGSLEARMRRDVLCGKLARIIESLALPRQKIEELPDTYAAAIRSGGFVNVQKFESNADYLPFGLLTTANEWVEIEFYQPDLHEDLSNRFVTLHTRQYQGRSYFRIFYRFPKGRNQLIEYLKLLDGEAVNWRQAAQNGFILLKKDVPQIPVGTQVALVQFMMTLDDRLRPTPTPVVESIRHRTFRNVDGSGLPFTNTGIGMHIMEYTLKRRLLFDGLKNGGLQRESADMPQYRIIFQPENAPDWGTEGRKVLFQQCADCHTTPKGDRAGVHSLPSIVHMGGFGAGAQLGIALPLDPTKPDTRGKRAAKWKSQHETYRRLLEHLGR